MLKPFTAVVFCWVLFTSAASGQPAHSGHDSTTKNGWLQYAPSSGGFVVELPAAPGKYPKSLMLSEGMLNGSLYLLESTVVYSIWELDFPQDWRKPAIINEFFRRMREQVLQEKQLTLLAESELQLGETPSLLLTVRASEKTLWLKLVLSKDRFYYLTAGFPNNYPFNDFPAPPTEANRFLTSFKPVPIISNPGEEVDSLLATFPVFTLEQLAGGANSRGVKPLSEFAVHLPVPPYPPVARISRIQGSVEIKVLIDESGRVMAAQVNKGHPLLQEPCLKAARQAIFPPFVVGGSPVKVVGTLIYNFSMQ